MNLNRVTLPVNDMDISTQFYRDLGFAQIVGPPTMRASNALKAVA
jgi:catechol 2,3-dioxygenase-like lactoylglutathione lyase family enzyme